MTREEAKKLFPIIQAFSEGRVIQYQANGKWRDYTSTELAFDMVPIDKNYRIKSEPKYRPFANAEECWNEMLKHQPFGYVYFADDNLYHNIIMLAPEQGCHEAYIRIGNCTVRGLEECFRIFTFADGLPFGVKVEED